MPYRLVGRVNEKDIAVPLADGRHLVGSGPDCQIYLDEPTVSRRHAELLVDGEVVEVVDQESRNGTFVGTRRVRRRRIMPGTPIGFGKIRLRLEQVSHPDTILGMELDPAEDQPTPVIDRDPASTVGIGSTEALVLETVPLLLRRVEAGEDELAVARAAAQVLFERLPARRAEVRQIDDRSAILFVAETGSAEEAETSELVIPGRRIEVVARLDNPSLVGVLRPLADTLSGTLRLAARGESPLEPLVGSQPPPLPDPATVTPAVRRIYEEASRVAQGDVGVLICGESGTGKEVLARYIHQASNRSDDSFVALNCAALPNDLLEAELFGIERGVATGVERRAGKFELAHGGTLFLDEIADMALETQAKILRVLQEGQVHRLGASAPHPANCRILAATNRDMGELRADGRFREDLFYRIATWVVELPPLRHRREDIPNLAAHFLVQHTRARGVRVKGITQGALDLLRSYGWPGNIRQLQNEMARVALFITDGGALESSMLGAELAHPGEGSSSGLLEERLERWERLEILRALQRCGGVATAAAEELGIGRSTLYRRMKALGIEPDAERNG